MSRNPPWEHRPSPECRYCMQMIHSAADHEEGCRQEELGPNEIYQVREEAAKAEKAERRLAEQRIQEAIEE